MHFPSKGKVMWADGVPTHVRLLACRAARKGAHGFEWLGGGFYSSVFRHEKAPGYVFKVQNQDNQDGYRLWAEEAMRHPDNPFMPKIYGIVDCGLQHRVYVLEVLTPVPDTVPDWGPRIHADRYLGHLDYGTPTDNRGLKDKLTKEVGRTRAGREFLEAVERIARIILSFQCAADLHSGNVMLRGDQVVITDPVGEVIRKIPYEHRRRPERTSTRKTRIRAEKALKSASLYQGSPTGPQATTGAQNAA